jgi:hypothetical protein
MTALMQLCRKHNRRFMADCFDCKQELHDLQYPAYALNRKKPDAIRTLDATFHAGRKYMTPGTYQGDEVLVHISSCKESGCNFVARALDWDGVDRMVWRHRREQILTIRVQFFEAALTSDGDIEEAMNDHADKHAHYLREWQNLVKMTYQCMMAPDPVELPPFQYEVYYDLGFTAHDAAKRVADRSL